MTCNTIFLVQRLIWKRFRWNFIDTFEDDCSLHTCFSADSLHLLCCIMPCESSGRFFSATRHIRESLMFSNCECECDSIYAAEMSNMTDLWLSGVFFLALNTPKLMPWTPLGAYGVGPIPIFPIFVFLQRSKNWVLATLKILGFGTPCSGSDPQNCFVSSISCHVW